MDGGKLLFQLFRIVLGFIAGLIACGLFLAWGFFQAAHPGDDPIAFATMVGTGLVSASVIGATALVPAAAAIAIAEAARLRGVIYHVGMAGGMAYVIWTLGAYSVEGGLRPGSAVAIAAGFLAGAVYWLVAGRTAGCWHGRAQARDERES